MGKITYKQTYWFVWEKKLGKWKPALYQGEKPKFPKPSEGDPVIFTDPIDVTADVVDSNPEQFGALTRKYPPPTEDTYG